MATMQAGAQVEFKGHVWTVKDIDLCDATPLAKAYNESIGVAGFAVLERVGRTVRGSSRVHEAVARIKTDGTVDKFI